VKWSFKGKYGIDFVFILVLILTNTHYAYSGNVSLCVSLQDCIDDNLDYLIVVADTLKEDDATYFNSSVDTLALHRADLLGLNVGIVSTASLDTLDAYEIRNFIKDVYESNSAAHMGDGKLGFVLLIGDVNEDDNFERDMVPTHYYEDWQTPPSDHYFACVTHQEDDYDDYPDLMIGRLSVGTIKDATTNDFIELRGVVNKTIAYDSFSQTGWGENVFLIASASPGPSCAADREQFGNCLDTLKTIIPNTYTIDEIRGWESPWAWNADSVNAAIINKINDGTWIVDFAGHGDQTYWKYKHLGPPILSVDDTSSLNNQGKYPIMFVMACKTGWYDNTPSKPDDCVGEVFVNAEDRGAIAYLGACRTPCSYESYFLVKSIHRSLFNDHDYFVGAMVASGKLSYLAKKDIYFSGSQHNDAHKYNLIGDPAINLGN